MEIYITKYALTKGIIKVKASKSKHSDLWKIDGSYKYYQHSEGFELEIDAIKDAEERKIKKLIQLDKQVKKISAITFSI